MLLLLLFFFHQIGEERDRSWSSASASFIIDLDSLCCRRNNIRSRRFVRVSIISPVGKECRPSFWYEFGFFWRFFPLVAIVRIRCGIDARASMNNIFLIIHFVSVLLVAVRLNSRQMLWFYSLVVSLMYGLFISPQVPLWKFRVSFCSFSFFGSRMKVWWGWS